MFSKFWTFTFGSCIAISSMGNIIIEDAYINRGTFQANDGNSFMYLACNNNSTFEQTNKVFELETTDTLRITWYNNDSIDHAIEVIDGQTSGTITPGASITIDYSFSSEGVFIYRGILDYPENTYLGLSGMIVVSNNSDSKFFWNIKEHQKLINDSIQIEASYDFQDYYPDYFTLNGQSAPDINNDPSARVIGSENDRLLIYITNTGQSVHSLHFHGYHLSIEYSSKFPSHHGRSKDTFAIYPQEGIVLELIPDKPGEFPVHDHNLIAVSGGGMYPIGRFLTMLIQ